MELIKVLCYILVLMCLVQAAPNNHTDHHNRNHNQHRSHRELPLNKLHISPNTTSPITESKNVTIEDQKNHMTLKAKGLGENVTINLSKDGKAEFSVKNDSKNDLGRNERSLSNKTRDTRDTFIQDESNNEPTLDDKRSVLDVDNSVAMHHCSFCRRRRRFLNNTLDTKSNVTAASSLSNSNYTGNLTNRTKRLSDYLDGSKNDTKISLIVKDDRMQITLDTHRPTIGSNDLFEGDVSDAFFFTPNKTKPKHVIKREENFTKCECSFVYMKNETLTRQVTLVKPFFDSCNISEAESQVDCAEFCKTRINNNESNFQSVVCSYFNTTKITLNYEAKACNSTVWSPAYATNELCCKDSKKVKCSNL